MQEGFCTRVAFRSQGVLNGYKGQFYMYCKLLYFRGLKLSRSDPNNIVAVFNFRACLATIHYVHNAVILTFKFRGCFSFAERRSTANISKIKPPRNIGRIQYINACFNKERSGTLLFRDASIDLV